MEGMFKAYVRLDGTSQLDLRKNDELLDDSHLRLES